MSGGTNYSRNGDSIPGSAAPGSAEHLSQRRRTSESETFMPSAPPWATHYSPVDVPQTQFGEDAGRQRSADARSRPSAPIPGEGSVYLENDAPDPRAVSGGSHQSTAEGEGNWKRPSSLAPAWAAGGGQEMLLSSPVQGRKVTFVLSKPAFYNVEDAPSAVPTRKGDRNWTPAADKHPRPKTPAVPSVLKIPGGAISSRAQTPMHLGAVSQPPPGRPGTGRLPGSAKESDNYGEYSMTAVEVLPGSSGHGIGPRESAARRPQTPGALHTYAGASDASTAEGGEEETAALRFVRQAEAALRNATHREGMEQQQRSSYPGQAGMDVPGGGTSSTISKGKDAHGDSRTAGRKGGEAGSGGREGDGGGGLGAAWRPKGSSAASTQRPLSARDRAKEYDKLARESAIPVKTPSAVAKSPLAAVGPYVKLGPQRASERVMLQRKAELMEAKAAAAAADLVRRRSSASDGGGGRGGGGGGARDLSPRSRQAKAREWDAQRRKGLYGGAEAAMAKTKQDMEMRRSLVAASLAPDDTTQAHELNHHRQLEQEAATLARVAAHRAGGAGVNHDERPVAAHRVHAPDESLPPHQQQPHDKTSITTTTTNNNNNNNTSSNTTSHHRRPPPTSPAVPLELDSHASLPNLQGREQVGEGEEAEDRGARDGARPATAAARQPRQQSPHQHTAPPHAPPQPHNHAPHLEAPEGGKEEEESDGEESAPEDAFEAVVWYRARAGLGDVDAMFNLAVCYEEGRGVARDEKLAFKWYQKAAACGDADALFSLGVCLHDGIGTPVDQAKAMQVWSQAAAKGNADAAFILDGLSDVNNNENKAIEYAYSNNDKTPSQQVATRSEQDDEVEEGGEEEDGEEEEKAALESYLQRQQGKSKQEAEWKRAEGGKHDKRSERGLTNIQQDSANVRSMMQQHGHNSPPCKPAHVDLREHPESEAEAGENAGARAGAEASSLSPVSRVMRGENLEQVARQVVRARMRQQQQLQTEASLDTRSVATAHGDEESVVIASALLGVSVGAMEKSLASASQLIPPAADFGDLLGGIFLAPPSSTIQAPHGREAEAHAPSSSHGSLLVSVTVPDALSCMSHEQLQSSMQAQSCMLLSQAAAQGLDPTWCEHAFKSEPAQNVDERGIHQQHARGRHLHDGDDEAELMMKGQVAERKGRGASGMSVSVDAGEILRVQELQHQVQALRAQAAQQEVLLRKSVASLASVGTMQSLGSEEKAAQAECEVHHSELESDDVYAGGESQDLDEGVREDEGRGQVEESSAVETMRSSGIASPSSSASPAPSPASTAAAVRAVAMRWSELKARQCGEVAQGTRESGLTGSSQAASQQGELGELAASPQLAEVAPEEAAEEEAETEAVLWTGAAEGGSSSLSSSGGSSFGSKARGGMLGMLSVSLQDSSVMQLPDTPPLLSHAHARQPLDRQTSLSSPDRCLLPDRQASALDSTQSTESIQSNQSTHGGHLGKLEASLSRSAALQLPPTPTPFVPAGDAGAASARGGLAVDTKESERDSKSRHGRLGMLAASLDASTALQLPPTPHLTDAPHKPQLDPAGRSESRVNEQGPELAHHARGGAGGEMVARDECVYRAVLEANERSKGMSCLALLVKYLDNVLKAPHEDKFRAIPKSNKAFKTRIACCLKSAQVLEAAGWKEEADSWRMPGDFSRVQVATALDKVQALIAQDKRRELDESLAMSVSGPLGRARQVLDLRRSLQKLDLAERQLATAYVGAVVSSALPYAHPPPHTPHLNPDAPAAAAAASSSSSSSTLYPPPSPWAGQLGGVVAGASACGNSGEGGGSRATAGARGAQGAQSSGEGKWHEDDAAEAEGCEQHPSPKTQLVAETDRSEHATRAHLREVPEEEEDKVVEAAGACAAESVHANMMQQVCEGEEVLGAEEEEDKEVLERLLDALTPKKKKKGWNVSPNENLPLKASPKKQPSSSSSSHSVGFRRSMRSSLSIQLGLVAAPASLPAAPSTATTSCSSASNTTKSADPPASAARAPSSSSSSSRFRGLGALLSPNDGTPTFASHAPHASHASHALSPSWHGGGGTGSSTQEGHHQSQDSQQGPRPSPWTRDSRGSSGVLMRAGGARRCVDADEAEATGEWGLNDSDHCLIGTIPAEARGGHLMRQTTDKRPTMEQRTEGEGAAGAPSPAPAPAPGDSGWKESKEQGQEMVAWKTAKLAGGEVEVMEGSLSLQRARRMWATLSETDQLSLTRGFFQGSVVTQSEATRGSHDKLNEIVGGGTECEQHFQGGGMDAVEEGEEMDLIYDPNLGLYFDPKTNSFFVRDAIAVSS